MPTKERYRKLVYNNPNHCPKCGKIKDDKDFVTCSKCRNLESSKQAKRQERKDFRASAMSLFGLKKKVKNSDE